MNSKRKILIVDDNAGNRLLLQYNLEGFIDIDFAVNGLSAVEQVSKKQYDLILMDIHMPDMDGIEATKKIRASEAESHIPIFAVTSTVYRDQKDDCMKAGMNDYIVKPIHAKALVERINHYFNTP